MVRRYLAPRSPRLHPYQQRSVPRRRTDCYGRRVAVSECPRRANAGPRARQSHVAGTGLTQGDFDELTTFARLPSEWDLACYYPTHARRAAQGPVSEAEQLAAQALREALAQQRAEREAAQLGNGTSMLRLIGSTAQCLTNIPVFITNIASIWTNQGWRVTFDIQGGTNGFFYDIFTTTALVGSNVTNAQWAWLEQGPTCSTYQYTNHPGAGSFYILGTPQDRDCDGLTDAFERLVSKTDPGNPDTDGDGLTDGWEVAHGMNPKANEEAQAGSWRNYLYDAVGQLRVLGGVEAGSADYDEEGNAITTSY